MKNKKRFRPDFPNTSKWKKAVSLLRNIDPDNLIKWILGQNVKPDKEGYHSEQKTVKDNTQNITTLSTRITTLEQLLEHSEVDLNQWEVSTYTINSWEMGSKNPSGLILPCALYQVKAILKPRKVSGENVLKAIIDEIKSHAKPVKNRHNKKNGKDLLIEVCIFDFHLAKLAFDTHWKNLWTLEDSEQIFNDIITDTLSRVDIDRVDRFVLPTGNDLLNFDNPNATTTKGTPQDSPQYWERLIIFAVQMLKRNIEKLSYIAPVYVPIVPGNHSENSMFSIGAVLEAAFSQNKNVHIDNAPKKRKCHHYGNCLIAYTHGNRLKPRDMHALMSTEWPELFGKTKYRAWHVGHLHSNRKSSVIFKDHKREFQGVEIEIVPSITVTDKWHYLHGYMGNIRRSKTFIWHRENGLIQELYYNL